MIQLDLRCAQAGERLARIDGVDEKLLNSALAVLQEQGLYACFLYFRAQGKAHATNMSNKMYEFLRGIPTLNLEQNQGNVLSGVAELAKDLDSLLFARELLLQALMYARYHFKVINPKSGGSA